MTTIATWAFEGTYDTDVSVKKHLAGMEEAAKAGAELIVFRKPASRSSSRSRNSEQ